MGKDITFKTAKLAKEKGFYIKGICSLDVKDKSHISIGKNANETETQYRKKIRKIYYETGIESFNVKAGDLVILCKQSVLQEWLRNFHHIHICISEGFEEHQGLYWVEFNNNGKFEEIVRWFESYEEALEEGLRFALLKLEKFIIK